MADKIKALSDLNTRQKVMAGVFALIMIIIIWQVFKMFSGGSSPTPAKTPTKPKSSAAVAPQTQAVPQKAQLIKMEQPTSAREAELMKLQQETQAKYMAAASELQMLRVARDIAETNQAIMLARLSAVTAQKKIVDMLSPPQPAQLPQAYSSTLVAPVSAAQKSVSESSYDQDVKYVVISVSQLQYRWNAVIGAKGVLYNVRVGDILPPDNSRVMSIDRTGVVLQRNGVRKKISMVPII